MRRLALAALLAVPGLLGTLPSAATPSEDDLAAARQRLEALNQHLSLLVEEYNQARIALRQAESKRAQAQRDLARARTLSARARESLDQHAVEAFTGMGTQLDVLLGADSFTEFSDRLEFLGQLAEADFDLALEAERAGQQATWAQQRLTDAVRQREQALATIDRKKDEIQTAIVEQQDLVAELREEVAQEERLAAQQASAPPPTVEGSIGGQGPPPPAPSPRAQEAIAAAWSVIGVPYQWGGASPSSGFDCSGLTMWAWAHAGVSLPHSSAAQYSALPKVSRDQLQPGDLVFFYSPISHVGLYIGGGKMIDAPHTGTTVQVRAVNWDSYVGAARPG